MKRRYKVLGSLLGVTIVAVSVFALVLSHEEACGTAPPSPSGAATMKAVVARCYGPPDVVSFEQVARPALTDDGVLIRVHAAAVNPLDKHYMRGTPYLLRLSAGLGAPDDIRMGVDFAGTVEAVGKNVVRFKPGDEVFGGGSGAFAEYVSKRENESLTHKPVNVSFEQAAAVPIAAVTALQALRDKGRIERGQRVLINGASGGVGTFAVQIARWYGAEITGVCSTRNVAMVRSLGADHVIDYTRENFTEGARRYDLIIDTVGNHSLSALRRAMTPSGTLVMVGGGGRDRWIGPLMRPLKAMITAPFVSQRLESLMARLNRDDLAILAGLMQEGKLRSVIDRHYPLSGVVDAMRYQELGRTRGKVIIDTLR